MTWSFLTFQNRESEEARLSMWRAHNYAVSSSWTTGNNLPLWENRMMVTISKDESLWSASIDQAEV